MNLVEAIQLIDEQRQALEEALLATQDARVRTELERSISANQDLEAILYSWRERSDTVARA
jgi:hypothetical protein